MKYVVLVGDGMSDYPLPELGNKTPLQVANIPNMDFIARNGIAGTVQTLIEEMPLGSDIANLNIIGYNPKEYYTGRAPLEAAGKGINLKENEIAFRCNLVTVEEDTLIDYSAGHISTEEAKVLIEFLKEKMGNENMHFYAGVSYRHLLIIKQLSTDYRQLRCVPPHEIAGQQISKNFPQGEGTEEISQLMEESKKLLKNHKINQKRTKKGLNSANMIWLWGQGSAPKIPSFAGKYHFKGAVITAVDLIKGIGQCIGLKVIDVPGATGYLDTDYQAKADYGLEALRENDFLYLHVEAPDEAGHNGIVKDKIKAIEDFDEKVVGVIIKGIKKYGEYKILVLPDHSTPVKVKTHTAEPVPFAIYSDSCAADKVYSFDEISAKKGSLHFSEGSKLMDYFLI